MHRDDDLSAGAAVFNSLYTDSKVEALRALSSVRRGRGDRRCCCAAAIRAWRPPIAAAGSDCGRFVHHQEKEKQEGVLVFLLQLTLLTNPLTQNRTNEILWGTVRGVAAQTSSKVTNHFYGASCAIWHSYFHVFFACCRSSFPVCFSHSVPRQF